MVDITAKDVDCIVRYLKKKFDTEWHSGDDSASYKILALSEFERAVSDYSLGKELANSSE